MSALRFIRLGTLLTLVAAGAAGLACGGEPPDKEMQEAQAAIDAARAAGASEYAKDEFNASVQALERAHKAAADRDYRQALNDALDSRERAQASALEGAEGKAAARVGAERAVAAAAGTLAALQKRLSDLEASKTPARALAESRKALAVSAQRVQEARAAFERGDFAGAQAAATDGTRTLSAAGHALDAAAAPPARRGR